MAIQQRHKAWDGAVISGTSILESKITDAAPASSSLGLLIDTSIAPTPASLPSPSIPTDLPSIHFETLLSTTSVASPASTISSVAAISTAVGEDSSQHVSSSSSRKSGGPSSALYISLIVLSILILLTLLALAWFALRRKRKEKAEFEEAARRYHAHGGSIDIPPQTKDSFKDSLLTGPTQTKDSFQDSLLTGPTLVQQQDARTSDRTLVPDPSTKWPLRSISRHKSNRILMPPAPPPKSEARSTSRISAPPSSPTIAVAPRSSSLRRADSDDAGPVGVHIPATHRIELSELSPVSPLSESDVLMRNRL
ncbi:hypothetical protein HII31_02753 [Pseudocercospora fuligena]|uniref:Uncharacterized protein n=1 Tax=Pseudocercospora fuligena TaxID=685502 RepID=A0A8H6RR82_9PEZI|nr:hypothetical protein HII31_02753 [Pseudocercospora fuligena]